MSATAEIVKDTFLVAERCSIDVRIRCDEDLAAGDVIEVQFPNSWCLFKGPSFTRELQTTNRTADNYIAATADGDASFKVEISKRNLIFHGGYARHGRLITATLAKGGVPAGEFVTVRFANTNAPYVTETESVWISVRGEQLADPPRLVTTPRPAEAMRILAPSGVKPGVPFEVLIISLDEFENRSSTTYENQTLTAIDGTVVADGLTFTGGVRVPITLAEEGVQRFRMGETVSNAVRCAADARGPYWGDIHIHTKLSGDAMGSDPYGYAREVSGLDFAGICDHTEDMGDGGYAQAVLWAEAAERSGEFAVIHADERNPGEWTGHHNCYFRDRKAYLKHRLRPGCFPRNSRAESEESIAGFDPATVMLIPHHTGLGWYRMPKPGTIGPAAVDWLAAGDDHGMRPTMEIYSHHGQSEQYDPQHILAYEFNRMHNSERRTNISVPGPFYAQDHWKANRRIGVIGSSDEHSGQGGRRHGGIAAVFVDELSSEAIFDAIHARHCYGTTGERILLEFTIDGIAMGREGKRPPNSKLVIRLGVWGTDLLLRVEILRYRFGVDDSFVPILSEAPRPESLDALFEIEDEFTAPAVYYARVTQQPLEWPAMAWTSPVWVDVD